MVFLQISQISQQNTRVGSLFLIKLQALLQHKCFSVKVPKFLRTPVLKNICQRLLLCKYKYKYKENI